MVVLNIDSGSYSQPPHLITTSVSSSEDDIEGGYSSSDSLSSIPDDDVQEIIAKSISTGKFARRLSQELLLRRRSGTSSYYQPTPTTASKKRPLSKAPASAPAFSLPSTIQFSIEDPVILPSCQKRKSASILSITVFTTFVTLIIGIATYTIYSQQNQIKSLQNDVSIAAQSRINLQQSHAKLIQDLHSAHQSLVAVTAKHDQVSKVNQDMNDHIKTLHKERMGATPDMLRNMEKKAEVVQDRLNRMVGGIQERSRKRVVEKYGPGPHHVEMEIQLPSSTTTSTIKIELAPVDLMPHAVHTFLEQVHQKAWDGTHFDLHAGHVLMARPDLIRENINADGIQLNNNKDEVPKVIFPEYNHKFPHAKYTLAFPGRANTGQDFYINLQNNTPHHSPRMLKDGHFVEGEPCFGKIVEESSRKVVDEMDRLSVGKGGIMNEPAVIRWARIV